MSRPDDARLVVEEKILEGARVAPRIFALLEEVLAQRLPPLLVTHLRSSILQRYWPQLDPPAA
jgi:hypothetical protein